jgi:hypothetical protein
MILSTILTVLKKPFKILINTLTIPMNPLINIMNPVKKNINYKASTEGQTPSAFKFPKNQK